MEILDNQEAEYSVRVTRLAVRRFACFLRRSSQLWCGFGLSNILHEPQMNPPAAGSFVAVDAVVMLL